MKEYRWTVRDNRKTALWTGILDFGGGARDVMLYCEHDHDNVYTVTIEAPDFETAARELRGQITDGLFENEDVSVEPDVFA